MKVNVKLYAFLSRYLPAGAVQNRIELEVPEGTTPRDIMVKLNVPEGACRLVLINGVYVVPSERATHALEDGDTLAAWPPVAGG